MSALHSVLRDRLHHAENVVEGAQRAYASALEEAREAGIEVGEPSVQVPVSLIENIDRDLGENAWHPEDCPGSHPAFCTCAVGKARRELRALLSQPNGESDD